MMELWPFTNFHDLNLDWIIKKIRNVEDSEAAAKASEEAAAASAAAAETSKINAAIYAANAESSAVSARVAKEFIETKAAQIDVNTAEINELVNGSTPNANAELIDIRVGYNGATYDTAGNAVRSQVTNLEKNFTNLNWWYNGEFASNNFNGVTAPIINEGRFVLNGQNASNANVYSKNLFIETGVYKLRLRKVSGQSTAGMHNFDPKIQLKDIRQQAIGERTSPTNITETEAVFDIDMENSGYIQLVGFLSANTVYTDYTIEIILVKTDVEPKFKYANFKTILSEAVRNLRGNVLWFAEDGDDTAPGTIERPKQNPAGFIAEGEHIILLRSGDTFKTPLGITPASETYIGVYGGPAPAVLDCEYENTNQFTVYDTDMYVADVDTINMGYLLIDGVKYWDRVPAFNMLDAEMSYYLDTANRRLYVRSARNLAGKTPKYSRKINGCTITGVENVEVHGIEIKNAGAHGFRIDNSENVEVSYNKAEHIGGCYLYTNNPIGYGNGIEVWMENCTNVEVHHNTVSDVFDTGITPQVGQQVTGAVSNNVNVHDNTIRRCMAGVEVYNTSLASTIRDIKVARNNIAELEDITGGFRRNSTVGQAIFANMYAGVRDTITIESNTAVSPAEYAVHFMEAEGNNINRFTFNDNIIVVDGEYSNEPVTGNQYAKCDFNNLLEYASYMGLLNR